MLLPQPDGRSRRQVIGLSRLLVGQMYSSSPLQIAFVLASLGIAGPAAAQAPPRPLPDTTRIGPVLEFDFDDVHVGIAAYPEGPTGVTVFHFPQPVKAAIDVRGGAPGVLNSETLRLGRDRPTLDAVVFSGGSLYGLAAATGVAEALKTRFAETGEPLRIARVVGTIIYDLGGTRRLNALVPDASLGAAALAAARPGSFPLGAQGAGYSATQGGILGVPQRSGQGAAFRQVGDTKIAVFTVVNALGTVVDRQGKIVRCGRDEEDCDAARDVWPDAIRHFVPANTPGTTSNTTITLVLTNERMPILELDRLAKQVHNSMARAIQPFGSIDDGDVLIAATTGEIETADLSITGLGVLASEVAWDAVLASVPEVPDPAPADPVSWSSGQMQAVAGDYRFSDYATVSIRIVDGQLVAESAAPPNRFFGNGELTRLIPVGPDELVMDNWRAHRIRLVREDGRVIALKVAPGRWEQTALKVDGGSGS